MCRQRGWTDGLLSMSREGIAFLPPLAAGSGRGRLLLIPDDISVVDYDDMAASDHLNPPPTTVKFPVAEIGHQAGRILLELVRTEGGLPPQTWTLPIELIVRAATPPPPMIPK